MRVLCLHPSSSSALQFSQELHKLEDRLWNKHGIELVFIDGPLLDAALELEPSSSDATNDDDNSDRVERCASRRWYVAESSSLATPSTALRYSGLDASLLHISQIWSRGGANNVSNNLGECMPFQGVLGYGQGADVAALLPLLCRHDDDDDSEENSATIENEATTRTMFEGLQFVILIDGKDILLQGVKDDDESIENDVYVGPDGIHSLHVILEGDDRYDVDRNNCRGSERLAKRYGPNATIHYCNLHSKQTATISDSTSSSLSLSSALFNIIGKFLVTQKNKLHSDSKSRELMLLQHQLLNVEQLATVAISEEIQRNPPNALMAVIGPSATMSMASSSLKNNDNDNIVTNDGTFKDLELDQPLGAKEIVKVVDKAVGAWRGGRRRGFGEEGGGAPCPEEFLLRQEERMGIIGDGEAADDDDSEDDIPILQNLDDDTAILPSMHTIDNGEGQSSNLPPVPVTILTGFLGSGKSTLVRYILTSATHQKRIAVIENEFGGGDNVDIVQRMGLAMNNDASTLSVETMIVNDGADGSNLADYVELPNGCVCCTVKDSLVATLEALLAKRFDLDYIIIEASGMADPGPVASIFWLDEALNSRLRLDGIVTCVDAKNIAFQLQSTSSAASDDGGDEAARQIAFADRIIVNKVDLLQYRQERGGNESCIESVLRQIQSINPIAPIKSTIYSRIEDLDWILDANCFDAKRAKDVESAFQLVIDDDAFFGGTSRIRDDAVQIQSETKCDRGCCSGNHPPSYVCGLCSSEPYLSSPPVNLHCHTNAVGTISLFGRGSVDLHRVHSWLASILWPNQDESDEVLRARLEALHLDIEENKLRYIKNGIEDSKSQMIYRVKGILSVEHALGQTGKIVPASNDWVDDGIVAGVVDTIDGIDKRRFILQAVHDLWDICPASENLNWEASETRCCKVIVIGKYLEREELQEGFKACFNN